MNWIWIECGGDVRVYDPPLEGSTKTDPLPREDEERMEYIYRLQGRGWNIYIYIYKIVVKMQVSESRSGCQD